MSATGTVAARLRLLGRVHLTTADGREITPRSAKARGLLAYLALAPGGTAPRAKVAGLLWGDNLSAMASLRQAVKEIRSATADGGIDVFVADHHELRLDLERIWVVQRIGQREQPPQFLRRPVLTDRKCLRRDRLPSAALCRVGETRPWTAKSALDVGLDVGSLALVL